MLNVFRCIFSNRFCCGWLSGIVAVFLAVLQLFYFSQWWKYVITIATLSIFYILFRQLAFKYLDE